MRAAELVSHLAKMAPEVAAWMLCADVAVTGITADSRTVKPGMIFAALPGARFDGRDFIADAVARGSIAVLAPPDTKWPAGVPTRPLLVDSDVRRRLAQISAVMAGRMPQKIVAVTGTNGKTSTVDFLRQILEREGKAAASLGTLGLIAKNFRPGTSLTTPDPVLLNETLARLCAAGFDHVAIEASSHGLDQRRLDGLCLAAAAFTNLTRDHLDYHRDITSYRLAKLRLFETILAAGAPALTMADLEPTTLAALRDIARRRKLALGTVGLGGDIIRLISVSAVPEGQALVLEVDGALRHIVLPLAGRFQIDNALLAAGLAREMGIANSVDHLADLVPVRGRLERVAILDHGATVYVDYAHTPDALARLLAALRPHARGRLVVVFGAGGNRDPGKRPLMGAIARRDADLAIITDDNPRDEDPASIRAGIIASCPGGVEIADRREAIAEGLAMLRQGDVLVVAGKGHEQGQIIGDVVLPFDDAAVIRELVG